MRSYTKHRKHMKLSEETLQSLKNCVLGHYPEIAKRASCSEAFVSLVLSGQRNSDTVILAAIETKKGLKAKRDELEKLANAN
ncbi:hypothetical protein D3C78_1662940 [compost metagenome]